MKQTYEVVSDDMDGSPEATTVSFSFEGRHFEIDLGQKNRDKLLNAVTPFMERARRVRLHGVTVSNGRREAEKVRDYDMTQLRAWASVQGIELPQRGRIPGAIVEQYKAWSTAPKKKGDPAS